MYGRERRSRNRRGSTSSDTSPIAPNIARLQKSSKNSNTTISWIRRTRKASLSSGTHVPDHKIVQKQSMPKYTEKSTITSKTKTFINCGAWITPKEPAQNDLLTRFFNLFINLIKPQKRGQKYTVPSNTFVYIDREGPPLLLQWNDEEHKRFVQGFKLQEQSAAH